jgi:hypothetical protein
MSSWNIVDADRGIAWLEYPFRKGAWATTFVFRGKDGLVVVSPASGLDDAAYDAIAELGEVRALVATNTFHHLGQAAWRARFPKAESYAAPAAVAKLAKKSKVPYRPIGELVLPDDAHAHVLPGVNNGEILCTVQTKNGSVWYTGDVFTNIQRTPGPPFSWLFKWTDSGPGFRLFKLGLFLFAKDKPALKQHLEALLAGHPPSTIVPGHGPALSTPDLPGETRAQLAKL